jgi:hypothetical protein
MFVTLNQRRIVAELTGRDDVMVTADWALLTEPNP